jgi:hypothetical protein
MIKIRHLAADKADKDPDLDFRQLRERDGRLAMKEIWVVQNYFQRLWLLVKHNQVDQDLVPDLFGDRLAWWVHHHYEKKLFHLNNSYAQDIEALWQWMQASTPAEHQTTWGATT